MKFDLLAKIYQSFSGSADRAVHTNFRDFTHFRMERPSDGRIDQRQQNHQASV